MTKDISDDLALLIDAATESGKIARHFWRNDPKTWDKGDGQGPVSEADLAVNDAAEAFLRKARPGYGWLSEESPDSPARLEARRVFIIDPIDGTRSFIEGNQGFAHAFAVAEAGRVIAAVVHLPVMDLTYTASADGPALLNGQPITPGQTPLAAAEVLTNKASLDARHWRGGTPPPFKRAFRPSLAWRLCLTAEGRFDAALTLRPAWEWDIAAASLIADRAGAAVSDRQGAALSFNNPHPQADGLIVASEPLHSDLLAALVPESDR